MITTIQNKQIKSVIKLKKSARERKKMGTFVVEGLRMFREIPKEMQVVSYATQAFVERYESLVSDCKIELVSEKVLKEISDTMTPQGILSIVRIHTYTMDDILKKQAHSILLLENIQDPGNLGTMIRTGEGAGVGGILMTKETVDIYNPKVIRSTMGSIFRVPFLYVDDLEWLTKRLKDEGFTLYAAHLNGTDYTKEAYAGKNCFCIGNEGNGLTDELTNMADRMVKIPMDGQVESLNAAMASGLFLYEARRQATKGE